MPTKTWARAKHQSLGDFAGVGNVGNGADAHMPVGRNNSGDQFRECIKFTNDWAGIERLTAAVLQLDGTGATNHISKGGSEGLRIQRINASSSFTQGGGGENYWETNPGNNGSVFGEPATIQNLDRTINPGNNVTHNLDVLAIVEEWLPSSKLRANGTPGGNQANRGFQLRAVDESASGLAAEFVANNWKLTLTYDDSVVPTIEWESPTDDATAFVRVLHVAEPLEEMTAELAWSVAYGPTDTALVTHSWELTETATPGVPVDSGTAPLVAGAFAVETVPLTPGVGYTVTVTVEGNGGAGVNVQAKAFVFPVGESVHALSLGINPQNVGVLVELAGEERETVAIHWAISTDGTEVGKVGDWSVETPDQWPVDVPAWLLARTRIARSDPDYVPVNPDGVDRIRVSYRGLT